MIEVVAVITLFALWVTLHVWLCAELSSREPRWRGLIAFLVPPLAPVWCRKAGLPLRAVAWWVLALAYIATLALSMLECSHRPDPASVAKYPIRSTRALGASPERQSVSVRE